MSVNKKNLYEIMVHLVLNACNSLIELKNYGFDYPEAKDEVLKLFNVSNSPLEDESVWKKKIINFSKCNYHIMKKLNEVIISKFGPVKKTQVPFKIKKGKAILVSDSSFSDLKSILEAVAPYNINVYTHHEMISAFQYEKLRSYKNLVGHYQRSNNNFPFDFYSFSFFFGSSFAFSSFLGSSFDFVFFEEANFFMILIFKRRHPPFLRTTRLAIRNAITSTSTAPTMGRMMVKTTSLLCPVS